MRDYIPRNYKLPRATYYQALYAVRDYDRLNAEYKEILHESAVPPNGLPKGNTPGRPTEDKALRLQQIGDRLTAIDRALMAIPEEYRKGVADNVRYKAPYPYTAGYATWSRWRRRFLYLVAKYLRLL